MPPMPQTELDEISEAFLEAWRDSFGFIMNYYPYDEAATEATKNQLYNETRTKFYDEDADIQFYGTFKKEPRKEEGDLGGKRVRAFAQITFVTKELRDQGVLEVDTRAQIRFLDRDNVEHVCDIIEEIEKVQFVDNYIFTSLRVREML